MLRTFIAGGLAFVLTCVAPAGGLAQPATQSATTTPAATAPATTTPVANAPAAAIALTAPAPLAGQPPSAGVHAKAETSLDFMSMLFVFMLATFIGIGVIRRVSRLLHTPLMSLTNAISAIAVVGSIMVAGGMREYPVWIRVLGAVALFCSMTNIISGFLITDRMLKMFKTRAGGKA